MNEIFNKGVENYIKEAQRDLRQIGVEELDIKEFSLSFKNIARENIEKEKPTHLEDFISETLRLAPWNKLRIRILGMMPKFYGLLGRTMKKNVWTSRMKERLM